METVALILAAGAFRRIRSDLTKQLHPLCGKPSLVHVMDTVGKSCQRVIPILGHGKDQILAALGDIPHAVQDFTTGKGTGHAVRCAMDQLEGFTGRVIITAGDMPLVTEASYKALSDAVEKGAAAALLYSDMDDPFGYGRVILDEKGQAQDIVEQKDLAPEQEAIRACNASVYCFDLDALRWALPQIRNINAANEYHLTDTISILVKAGHTVASVVAKDPDECRGFNTRVQLAEANEALRKRINRAHLEGDVSLMDPSATYIDSSVEIGYDTLLYPGVSLEGKTRIGSGCVLHAGCQVRNSILGDHVIVQAGAVIHDSTIPSGREIRALTYIQGESIG